MVVCLGTGQDVETESKDRNSLDLPGFQLDLLKDAVFAGTTHLASTKSVNLNRSFHVVA